MRRAQREKLLEQCEGYAPCLLELCWKRAGKPLDSRGRSAKTRASACRLSGEVLRDAGYRLADKRAIYLLDGVSTIDAMAETDEENGSKA